MKGAARRCIVRRGVIIALIAVAELGCAGLVIDVAASAGLGLASTVTVSIDGAIGTWGPASTQSTAPAPAASLDPSSGQPIAPPTPSTLETTPSTSAPTAVAPVEAPSSSSEPDPATP